MAGQASIRLASSAAQSDRQHRQPIQTQKSEVILPNRGIRLWLSSKAERDYRLIVAVATKWNDIAYYQVPTDDSFRLKPQNPDFTGEIDGKKQAAELLQGGVEQLAERNDGFVLWAS